MPYNEIEANRIPPRALFGQTDTNSASFVGVSSTTPDSSNDILFEAGENITANNAVRLFTDGKIYHASPLNSTSKYAQYFAVETVTSGSNVNVRRYGEIQSTNTLTVNLPVYLSVMSGGINISQNPILSKSATSDLWQYLGYAKATDTITIDIKLPELFR